MKRIPTFLSPLFARAGVHLLAAAMLVAVVAGGGMAARAQTLPGGDSKAPIEIQADNLEVRREQQLAVFTGNVDARQGGMTLRTDELRVSYREGDSKGADVGGGISRLEARGNVSVATATDRATGDVGIYDVDAGTIVLEGNVRLFREQNVLVGQRLVMHMDSGVTRLDAGPGTGRVKGIFQPGGTGQ